MWENIFTLNLSISDNFEQLWFLWQKSPPPPKMRDFFYTGSIHFRQFRATLVFVAEKPPPLPPRWGKFFVLDLSISGNFEHFGFCGRKAPLLQDEGIFFTLDLSISGNFEQLWFLWQKSPPSKMRKFFTLDISISGNFEQLWFLWQKSPPPRWGNFFYTGSIHFRQFEATLVFVAEKPPAPEDEGNIFLHWIYQFQVIMSNFGFCGRKAPPENVGKFFTLDLSISGNFKQLWFLWQKSPPTPKIRIFFYTGSIHFRQFWATLDFVTQKPPPPQNEGIFLHWIYPFQAISSNFGFCGRKALPPPKMREILYTGYIHFRQFWATLVFVAEKPPLQDEGFFYTGSIHFRQFQATLVFVAEKPPPKDEGNIFLHWIYPFQVILSNFGFCGRKAPLKMWEMFLHWIYPFQVISSNFGFLWHKSPPTPKMREFFFTLDLSISGNFEQLWLLWQKSPLLQDEGKFFTLDLSISGIFEQLWILLQKSLPPSPMWENIFTLNLSISDNFE